MTIINQSCLHANSLEITANHVVSPEAFTYKYVIYSVVTEHLTWLVRDWLYVFPLLLLTYLLTTSI